MITVYYCLGMRCDLAPCFLLEGRVAMSVADLLCILVSYRLEIGGKSLKFFRGILFWEDVPCTGYMAR